MEMSNIESALKSEPETYTQHYVLLRLAGFADEHGVVSLGMLRLADACKMQHQTLKRTMQLLADQQLVEVIKTPPCNPDLVQLKV